MKADNDKYLLQSVANSLDLLDLLEKHKELTVPEISAITGQSRSSVFRMLATLEDRNYVKKTEDAHYSLDVKLIALGNAVTGRLEVVQFGHPFLLQLTEETGETSHLGVFDRDVYIRFVDKVLSLSTMHMDSLVGFRRKAHLVACGKVLLAYQPQAVVDSYIQTVNFEPVTETSITSGEQLRRELADIRTQGFAFDREEGEPGLFCIAAPIFDRSNQVVAAVSISGPAERMRKNLQRNLPYVLEAADRIRDAMRE